MMQESEIKRREGKRKREGERENIAKMSTRKSTEHVHHCVLCLVLLHLGPHLLCSAHCFTE